MNADAITDPMAYALGSHWMARLLTLGFAEDEFPRAFRYFQKQVTGRYRLHVRDCAGPCFGVTDENMVGIEDMASVSDEHTEYMRNAKDFLQFNVTCVYYSRVPDAFIFPLVRRLVAKIKRTGEFPTMLRLGNRAGEGRFSLYGWHRTTVFNFTREKDNFDAEPRNAYDTRPPRTERLWLR